MGRHHIPFDPVIAEEICDRMVSSRMGLGWVLSSMRDEAEFAHTPGLTTVYRWMESNPDFAESSARARQLSADTYADLAVQEAHEARTGTMTTTMEWGEQVRVADNVERSKLIVQTLMKRAGQLNPKKYGEKLVHQGDENAPLAVRVLRVK